MKAGPILLFVVLGLGAGWLLGKTTGPAETVIIDHLATPPKLSKPEPLQPTPPAPATKAAQSIPLRKFLALKKRVQAVPLEDMPGDVARLIADGSSPGEIMALLQEWENRDPEHFLKWRAAHGSLTNSRPFSMTGLGHGTQALKRLALNDPEAAWEQAGKAFTDPGAARWNLVGDLFSSHPEQAMALARAHLKELSASRNPGAFGQFDPFSWQPLLTALEPGVVRRGMIRQGFDFYLKKAGLDTTQAVNWLDSLPSGLQKEARQLLQRTAWAPAGLERENLAKLKAALGIPPLGKGR